MHILYFAYVVYKIYIFFLQCGEHLGLVTENFYSWNLK